MNRSRPAAERVRPILEAMERSIDDARRRRLKTDDPPVAAPRPLAPSDRKPTAVPSSPVRRLKARPKRALPMSGYPDHRLPSAG